jgi:hypothetical protein
MTEESKLIEEAQNTLKRGLPFKGSLLPKQSLEYGDYMNLKIFSLNCYCTLADEQTIVVLLKDN